MIESSGAPSESNPPPDEMPDIDLPSEQPMGVPQTPGEPNPAHPVEPGFPHDPEPDGPL